MACPHMELEHADSPATGPNADCLMRVKAIIAANEEVRRGAGVVVSNSCWSHFLLDRSCLSMRMQTAL